jgi:hypothetical protein
MLTPAQRTTLRTFLLAQTDQTLVDAIAGGNDGAVANWLNAEASPQFFVWRSTTPVDDVTDAILWAKMTPADAPDGTQIWANRSLAAQGKQFNLQNIFLGRNVVATGKGNIRTAIEDSLTNLPTAVAGAVQGAGWNAVKAAISRPANRLEKSFATGTGTAAAPATLVAEGSIDSAEIASVLRP